MIPGDRDRGPPLGSVLVQCPRRQGRAGPFQQRLGLQISRLAGRLHRARHHSKKTRPSRPQTNGKVEHFHRTLADGWAFSRHFETETARRNALPEWLHYDNYHRPHTAISTKPPNSRITNVPGQYS